MTKIQEAIDTLTEALENDPGYRQGWQANIAMAFFDECSRDGCRKDIYSNLHEISNKAASNFLTLLCNTRKK